MARQRLMVGTYGEISCFQLKSGSWQARARYCDVDGVVRQYRKNGETKNKARANLKAFFVEHTGTFGDGALAPDMFSCARSTWLSSTRPSTATRPRPSPRSLCHVTRRSLFR
jgi:hypothetical protein